MRAMHLAVIYYDISTVCVLLYYGCINVLFVFQGNRYEQEKLLKQSCTLYVGNLSFYTTEEQVWSAAFENLAVKCIICLNSPVWCHFYLSLQVQELFSKSGDVKRIIIGLDKVKKTACGFCFVEYPFPWCLTANLIPLNRLLIQSKSLL